MSKTHRMVLNGLLLAILIIFSKITVQTVIPFTLQLFAIFLISFMCPLIDSVVILLIYVVMGILGFPVFSTGGGLNYIYQPTFGFLIGFIVMLFPMSLIKKCLKNVIKNEAITFIIAGLVGILIDYIIGFTYSYFVFNIHNDNGYSIAKILSLVILPFIIFDLAKLFVSAIIAKRVNASRLLMK